MYYNFIESAEESTVLAQYVREERAPYGSYQSEAALEGHSSVCWRRAMRISPFAMRQSLPPISAHSSRY